MSNYGHIVALKLIDTKVNINVSTAINKNHAFSTNLSKTYYLSNLIYATIISL